MLQGIQVRSICSIVFFKWGGGNLIQKILTRKKKKKTSQRSSDVSEEHSVTITSYNIIFTVNFLPFNSDFTFYMPPKSGGRNLLIIIIY